MFKLYKEAFKTTIDTIILATPLVLFTFVLSIYLSFSKSSINSVPLLILTVITVLLMISAFMSGWFYMVKKAVKLSQKVFVLDADRAKATFALLKTIPTGIGKYFLPFLVMNILLILIIILLSIFIHDIGMILVGDVGIAPDVIKNALLSSENLKPFLESLSYEQLVKLNYWNLLILFFNTIFTFLFMLLIPEIIYSTSNPFKAMFKSIVKLFSKFYKSIKLYFYIAVVNFILSLLNSIVAGNLILYFLVLLLYFYFIVYITVLIFTYYEKEFQ